MAILGALHSVLRRLPKFKHRKVYRMFIVHRFSR